MTTLQAVNEMLTACGLRPVASTSSGLAAEAALYLARWSEKVQAPGWHCNTEGSRRNGLLGVALAPPDVSISYSGAAPAFTVGETLTQETSGATGRYQYNTGTAGKVYLTTLTGTFTTGDFDLVGGTSAVTKAGVTLAAVTSGSIYVDADILSADPVDGYLYPDVTLRGGRFYDLDDDTFDFSEALRVVQVRLLAFADLPGVLQELITCHALIDFAAKLKVPQPTDAAKRLQDAKFAAARDDMERGDYNVNSSPYAQSVAGRGPIYPR